MSNDMRQVRRYRFGPLPQHGVLGALRAGQIGVLAITVLAALGSGRDVPGVVGALVAAIVLAGGAAGAFGRVRGRGLDEWVPVAVRHWLRRVRGETAWRSPLPSAGVLAHEPVLPSELADIEVLEVPWRGGTVGICKGKLDGTYTAILAVRTQGFGLSESGEQERAAAQWGTALASLAAERSPISRVSWVERSVPSDGDALGRYLAETRDETVPLGASAMQSYLELLEEPGVTGKEHELFLAMQISRSRGRVEIREEGGDDEAACRVLLRELSAWAETVGGGPLNVRGVLTPRMLARVLRTHYDPFARQALARMEAGRGSTDGGTALAQAAPLATEEAWQTYRSDGALHTTYWIAEWPRVDVGLQFLAPLLLSGSVIRSTAVVMEVLAPSQAERRIEHARTREIAEAARQQREGGLITARQRRRWESTAAREDELSRGHALARHAGFVTVSSASLAEHRRNRLQIETLARRARMELRVMYGEQAAALTFTTVLCRGLR